MKRFSVETSCITETDSRIFYASDSEDAARIAFNAFYAAGKTPLSCRVLAIADDAAVERFSARLVAYDAIPIP
jgi:hypothetical protein